MLPCLLYVAAVVAVGAAQQVREQWTRAEYPNPMEFPYKCGRFAPSHICDPNGIISPEEANQLDIIVQRVANNTRCPCSSFTCRTKKTGYMIGVALMKQMATGQDEQQGEDLQSKIDDSLAKARLFAYTLEQTWGLGSCNEDIIILYSQDDNVLYTMTGGAASRKLHSSQIGAISMDVRSLFGPNKPVFDGLMSMIQQYQDALNDQYVGMQMVKPVVAALTNTAPSLQSYGYLLSSICAFLYMAFS